MYHCDNCGSAGHRIIYQLNNVQFLPGPVVECTSCGLRYRYIDISEDELARFYELEQYGNESYLKDYGADYARKLPASEINVYEDVLDLMEKIRGKKGTLLEVGCASGILLDMARQKGWSVSGIEVSPSLAETGRKNFGIDIQTGTIENAAYLDQSFDCIIMWDVIEHFLSPSKIIGKSYRLLKPGGIIVLFTQDNDSFLVWLGSLFNRIGIKTFLYHLFDNYHLYFYNQRSLRRLLENHEFSVAAFKHYPAELSKRTWSGISFDAIVRIGTKFAVFLSGLLGRHYRMAVIARKK